MNDHNRLKKTIHLPDWELEFRADRSSGPGGQNVNKTATKITVHFDVEKSKTLDADQKQLVKRRLKNMINKEGELVLSEQSSRSQLQNRIGAVSKLEELISEALILDKERIATGIPQFVREKRIQEKKTQGKKKETRRPLRYDE